MARLLVIACVLALGGACSDVTDEPDAAPTSSPASVTLSITQLLPDEGTRKALLRVVNDSDEPLPVTGAGLRWSGYGEFVDPQDRILTPGQTLDLHVVLPAARCDEGDGPVVGVLRTPTEEVAQPLTSSGQRFLRHLWLRGCQADLVSDQVSMSYADDWRVGVSGGEPAALGSLLLRRGTGSEDLTVLSGSGSVLYDLEVPDPVVARPDEARTLVPMRILPGNRCDEHARGQATAPFTFRVWVRVADTRAPVLVIPPPRVQTLASKALDQACRLRA